MIYCQYRENQYRYFILCFVLLCVIHEAWPCRLPVDTSHGDLLRVSVWCAGKGRLPNLTAWEGIQLQVMCVCVCLHLCQYTIHNTHTTLMSSGGQIS